VVWVSYRQVSQPGENASASTRCEGGVTLGDPSDCEEKAHEDRHLYQDAANALERVAIVGRKQIIDLFVVPLHERWIGGGHSVHLVRQTLHLTLDPLQPLRVLHHANDNWKHANTHSDGGSGNDYGPFGAGAAVNAGQHEFHSVKGTHD